MLVPGCLVGTWRYHAFSCFVVEKRSLRETLTCIVLSIESMIDLASVLACLGSKIILLPFLACFSDKRTLDKVLIPF